MAELLDQQCRGIEAGRWVPAEFFGHVFAADHLHTALMLSVRSHELDAGMPLVDLTEYR